MVSIGFWTVAMALLCQSSAFLFEKDGPLNRAGSPFIPPSALPEDSSVLNTPNMPSNPRHYPEVGNGHLATVVQQDTIYMNGLFNGFNTTSHRARISSTVGYVITATKPAGLKRTFTLDMGRGFFAESYTGSGVTITLRTYAHRVAANVLVAELVMSRDDVSVPVSATLTLNSGNSSEDSHVITRLGSTIHYRTNEAEFEKLAPRTDFYVKTSPSLSGEVSMTTGTAAQSFVVLSSIGVDENDVNAQYAQAEKMFQAGSLLSSHVEEWTKAWNRGRIDVKGDLETAKNIYSSFYYLFASLPFTKNNKAWPYIGLSPGGLAHGPVRQDYYGHVFWDQDTWMYPGLAFFHSDIGQLLVETRTKTVEASKLYAAQTGYEGARYAWESAFTGMETCPAPEPALYEIHITGDVAMMIRQQWQLTTEIDDVTANVVMELAKYWASRVVYRASDDSYRILKAMGPDEFHQAVNDSIYTNAIAALTFNFANEVRELKGMGKNSTWETMAQKIRLLYDPVLDYHPEFDGYTIDTPVKQADVVLLNFPLMLPMNASTMANDLHIYEEAIPKGPVPAMTWGMHLIGWLQLGNESRAADLLKRTTLNAQEPFLIWTENANGMGAINFITGMGGYLQALIFGYGGCRLHNDRLDFNLRLIPGTTEVKYVDVDYKGFSFDLEYDDKEATFTLVSEPSSTSNSLIVDLGDKGQVKLVKGVPTKTTKRNFKILVGQK